MPEIVLPSKWTSNELGVISALLALIGYCVYPNDPEKASETRRVLNIAILHKLKYGLPDPEKDEDLKNPEKAGEFWSELKEFGEKYKFDVPTNIVSQLTPLQFAKGFISELQRLASGSLELPENIERFLLNAPTPPMVLEGWKSSSKGLSTAVLVLIKLMQIQKHAPNIRGGASIKKAIDLLCCEGVVCPLKNPTDIRKAWDAHKKSVHLTIGLTLTIYTALKTDLLKKHTKEKGYAHDLLSPLAVSLSLVFAKGFQEWLLSFKLSIHTPVSTATRLIKPQQMWLVPEFVKGSFDVEKYSKGISALTPKEITCLEQKRSYPAILNIF